MKFFVPPFHYIGTLETQDYFLLPIKEAGRLGFDSFTITFYGPGNMAGKARGKKKRKEKIIFLHGLSRRVLLALIFFTIFKKNSWKIVWFGHVSFGGGYPYNIGFDVLKLMTVILKRVDFMASISLYEYEYFKQRGFKNAYFVPLPLDFGYYSKIKRDKTAKNILFMGGDREVKNLETVLKAFKIVREKKPGVKLLVLGEMKKRRSLFGVEFLGQADPKSREFRDAFSRSLVFINASFYEGQPSGIMEAAADGLGLCLSNIPSTFRIFSKSALFFEPFDYEMLVKNVMRFLSDEKLRRDFAAKNYDIAKKYDIEEFLEKFRKMLGEF